MKTKIMVGSGIVSALLLIILQSQMLEQERIKIRALERSLVEHEEYVSELEKTSQELSMELTECETEVSDLKNDIELLQKEVKELERRLSKLITLEATAYTAFCDTGCSGFTKTGVDVRNTEFHKGKRVVAVDPDVIPLGTEMIVHTSEGSFEAIAEDTGEDIQGHRIDILVPSKDIAYDFGRQKVVVELLIQKKEEGQ